MYVWGVSDEGPENGCGPDLKHQRRLEKEPDGRGGAAKQGWGCESSKILSLQRPGLCVSMAVSDALWKRKLQEKEGFLLLGEEGHKGLESQTLVPGRILFCTFVLSDYKDPAAGIPLSNKFPGSEPNLEFKKKQKNKSDSSRDDPDG